jgi:hypothetical protein
MWAATMKVMAGTQMLLPTSPAFAPVVLPHPRGHQRAHPYPINPYPSAPPGSPSFLPRPHHAAATLMAATSTGILQEASAACTRMTRVAQALERRSNAERRISRRRRPRTPLGSVGRAAAASTVPAIGYDMPCRVATVHPSRPSAPSSLSIIGAISDAPSSPPPHPLPPCTSSPRTYVDTGTEPLPAPTSCDVGVDASLPHRSFSDTAVGNDDHDTTYGVIADPFARDLARLLPWSHQRECTLAQIIWLDDWQDHIDIFKQMPPFLRIYLHALFMLFRPGAHAARRSSIPPGFAPVFNLFAHWWSAWNAITTPHGPPEPDVGRRYYHLTHDQLHGKSPLEGRGFIMDYASSFS